jgi:hypothetical protein
MYDKKTSKQADYSIYSYLGNKTTYFNGSTVQLFKNEGEKALYS